MKKIELIIEKMVKKVLNESFNRTLLINKFKKTKFKIRKNDSDYINILMYDDMRIYSVSFIIQSTGKIDVIYRVSSPFNSNFDREKIVKYSDNIFIPKNSQELLTFLK